MVEDIFGKYWYLRVSISSAANACQEHKSFRLLLLGLPAPGSRSLRQKLMQKVFHLGIHLPSQYGGLVVIMVTYATSEKGLLKSCSQIFHQQKGIINTKDSVNISLVGVSWIHCLIDMKLTLFLNICWELRRYFLRLSFGLTKNLHEILAVNI